MAGEEEFLQLLMVGGNQFFDINQLPMSMIERVDFLTDGASAVYGSPGQSLELQILLLARILKALNLLWTHKIQMALELISNRLDLHLVHLEMVLQK